VPELLPHLSLRVLGSREWTVGNAFSWTPLSRLHQQLAI
jgi:hypothetical protein